MAAYKGLAFSMSYAVACFDENPESYVRGKDNSMHANFATCLKVQMENIRHSRPGAVNLLLLRFLAGLYRVHLTLEKKILSVPNAFPRSCEEKQCLQCSFACSAFVFMRFCSSVNHEFKK